MNRTKLLTITVLGLLLINISMLCVLIIHRPHHPPMGEMNGPPGEGPKRIIIARLHFDDAQQQRYQVLIDEHRKKMRELNDATRKLHDSLFTLLKDATIDQAKADTLMQQIAANQKQTDELNFDHFQKIKSICKPEQLKDFNELVEELGALFAPGRK
ncbi:MAG: hypothetical protein JWP12_1555 [Bacteroidetes bacterium]|nr:hypothetical protein [Bacteroidota bacterium]